MRRCNAPPARFEVRKGGIPLQESSLKFGIKTGITETPAMTEYEAVVAAGLDLWKWEQQEYPTWFRANVLAWHTGHVLKEIHSQDVVSSVMESKRKKRQK